MKVYPVNEDYQVPFLGPICLSQYFGALSNKRSRKSLNNAVQIDVQDCFS